MKISYSKKGDYLIPDLRLEMDRRYQKIGKYGRMRLKFLKEEMKGYYTSLLMKDRLTEHLSKVDALAKEMELRIINGMVKYSNVNEELKAKDQMEWVRMMNMISNMAFEYVCGKVIYTYREH